MRVAFKWHPVTALLATVCAGLSVATWWVARTGQTRVHEPDHLTPHAVSVPDLSPLIAAPVATADLATIRDQAVFHSRRLFYVPPPPSQLIPAPEYDFSGSMVLRDGKRIAFVKKKSGDDSRTLHVGDDLDGWKVDSIESTQVVLVRSDQRAELASPLSAPIPGLVHSDTVARVIPPGPRVLGAQGANPAELAHSVYGGARTYRPPPK